ncbi:hypothetical protein M5689_020765 [Euphorbia peplus]|nr:hypothetical protein M5689_020765 [Euphorbia peplus]
MAPGTRSKTNVRASTNETTQSQSEPLISSESNLTSNCLPTRLIATLTSEANNVVNEKKRGRGKARGFEVKKRLKEGKKSDGVTIVKDNYVPVGPTEKIIKIEIGVVTRLLAPLQVFYWKHMPEDKKQPLFARLESEFELSFDDPHVKEVVDAAMEKRFKQYKHQCHKHYKTYSPEDAKKNPPEDVTLDDWVHLCNHFESDAFKQQSTANKLNRGKLQITNRTGVKLYAQRIFEMGSSQVTFDEPLELKLYFDVHHKKNGTWDHPEAQENYEKMIEEFQKSKEEEVPLTGQQILEKVLKPKCGYSRGLGYGTKPSTSRAAHVYQESFQSEKQARELLEEKVQTQNERIKSQEETIKNLKASHDELKTLCMSMLNRNGGRTFSPLED